MHSSPDFIHNPFWHKIGVSSGQVVGVGHSSNEIRHSLFQHLYGLWGGQIGILELQSLLLLTHAKSGHNIGFDLGHVIKSVGWTKSQESLSRAIPPLGHFT